MSLQGIDASIRLYNETFASRGRDLLGAFPPPKYVLRSVGSNFQDRQADTVRVNLVSIAACPVSSISSYRKCQTVSPVHALKCVEALYVPCDIDLSPSNLRVGQVRFGIFGFISQTVIQWHGYTPWRRRCWNQSTS